MWRCLVLLTIFFSLWAQRNQRRDSFLQVSFNITYLLLNKEHFSLNQEASQRLIACKPMCFIHLFLQQVQGHSWHTCMKISFMSCFFWYGGEEPSQPNRKTPDDWFECSRVYLVKKSISAGEGGCWRQAGYVTRTLLTTVMPLAQNTLPTGT